MVTGETIATNLLPINMVAKTSSAVKLTVTTASKKKSFATLKMQFRDN
jgi:hypothetical protein